MIYKWTIPMQIISGKEVYPPAIIDIMIEMFLNGGQIVILIALGKRITISKVAVRKCLKGPVV
jgi:hypothetical protein